MALKVNKEYGVTIGGRQLPLGAAIVRTEKNAAEVDDLLKKGYVIDTKADKPEPKKDEGGN